MPDNPVDEEDEVREECPANIEDCAGVPNCKMGGRGDGKKDEANCHGDLMVW